MTIAAIAAPEASGTLLPVSEIDGAELVGTADAARALRIDRRTLSRWAAAGHVTPEFTTAGGHLRWDLQKLKAQVDAFSEQGKS